MTTQISEKSKDILNLINKSQKVLLHCHPSPDPDSIGSALAMKFVLEQMGKEATVIIGDSEPPSYLNFLPGGDKIVLKNYFQITPENFDLFIILDTSSLNQISKLGSVIFPDSLKTIVIDHHGTNEGFGDINLCDSLSPATSQMLFELFSSWNQTISSDAAECLILGIYADTGGFKYPKTTTETFNIAAKLCEIAPDYSKLIFNFENNNEPGKLIYRGLALSSVEIFFSGNVAISFVSYDQLQKLNLVAKDTEKSEISNEIKSVIGWNIGICAVEKKPGELSCSMRTRDPKRFDVSKIGSATGAGGGHPAAAGGTIYKPFNEAKQFLLEIIQKTYPELGNP